MIERDSDADVASPSMQDYPIQFVYTWRMASSVRKKFGFQPSNQGRILFALAAPIEFRSACTGLGIVPDNPLMNTMPAWGVPVTIGSVDLMLTGIGKANAAGAVARALDPTRHGAVVSVGIAGALPGPSGMLAIGTAIAASSCVMADEGVRTPDGFLTCERIGFPLADFPTGTADGHVPVDARLLDALAEHADATSPIATVSTCSGTDASSREVAARTGAACEAMEGAAVALVGHRLGIAAGEYRVISNTTGDRATQVWNIRHALDRLSAFFAVVRGAVDE
jgi:futalosine hydrolase